MKESMTAKIVPLLATLTNVEIAIRVGCSKQYVRAIRGRFSAAQKGQHKAAQAARSQVLMSTADKDGARRAGRVAYQQAKLSGASPRDCSRAYTDAWAAHMHNTGDKKRANRAARKAWKEARPL